jgi:hypothetical protein
MEQRYVEVDFQAGLNVLDVQAPPDGNIAPPGYYMLFIVNAAGVPSESTFIRLGNTLDSDADGLTDDDEINTYSTDPMVADTDGDSLSDGDEALVHGTNPLDADTDGDSYNDGDEVFMGTDPLIACGPDAWPPDTFPLGTPDGLVDGQDIVAFLPALFAGFGSGSYIARLDIFAPGGVIDGQDTVMVMSFLFQSCTPP